MGLNVGSICINSTYIIVKTKSVQRYVSTTSCNCAWHMLQKSFTVNQCQLHQILDNSSTMRLFAHEHKL